MPRWLSRGCWMSRRVRIASKNWPVDYPDLRIMAITDLHVGCPSVSLEMVSTIVQMANAERPDLIVLLGDYVSQDLRHHAALVPPGPIAERLAALSAPLGVVAVLGNHDWMHDGWAVRRALEDAGIAVLENNDLTITHQGRPVQIGGLADDTTRAPDIRPILQAGRPDVPLVLLAHDPASFMHTPATPAVMLAGHTHGGQVRLPLIGALHSSSRAPMSWIYGHTIDRGRDIFVSGGIGTSLLPIRFNMPPEIVMMELTGAGGVVVGG